MQLSRVTPINIDVFEFLLPKLELMLVRPSYKGDEKTAEARFISYLQELSFDSEQTQKLIKNIEYWQRRVDDEYELMKKKQMAMSNYMPLITTNTIQEPRSIRLRLQEFLVLWQISIRSLPTRR